MNLYLYVKNDPLNNLDPSGLSTEGMGVFSPDMLKAIQTAMLRQMAEAQEKWNPRQTNPEYQVSMEPIVGYPPLPGVGRAAGVISRIKESPKLVRAAEASSSVQRSIDRLTAQLARGNLNPGIGTKSIGKGIFEARARDGARVYFRQTGDGTIEILGKSTKANQQSVIDEVLRRFGD